MLRKILCALLFGTLLAACRSDDESSKIFVTEIEIAEDAIFAPGDRVTVRAVGFEPQDLILFDIRFPLEDEHLSEGYAKGIRAVEHERTANSITFLAPGGYPASTVGILLFRDGYTQTLGTIRVSDGVPPAEYCLYGVLCDGDDTHLMHIDSRIGGVTERMRIETPLCCPVNEYGTNRIYGLAPRAGGRVGLFCDLTMSYWADSDPQQYVAVGTISSSVGYLTGRDGQLWLEHLNTTRTSPVRPVRWTLPEGVTPEMLGATPFVATSDGYLLLAADRGDGNFVPVVLCAGSGQVGVGDPIEAERLVPFVTVRSREEDGQQRNYQVGGYVISKPGGGASELCLFDIAAMRFGEPFATLDDAVISVTVDLDREEQLVYLLTEDGEGMRRIRIYDQLQQTWQTVPIDVGIPYCAIILAR